MEGPFSFQPDPLDDRPAPAQVPQERRQFARVSVTLPAKVRCCRTGRYYAARTLDRSPGGVRLELAARTHLGPGDEVEVVVAEHARDLLLKRQHMIRARVLRSMAMQTQGLSSVSLALSFSQPAELSQAG